MSTLLHHCESYEACIVDLDSLRTVNATVMSQAYLEQHGLASTLDGLLKELCE